jgi:putative N-acetylmannosamine-6-phosphate epimerase
VTTDQYRTWLKTQLNILSQSRYSDPKLAQQYELGFLLSMAAEAMTRDNAVASRFRQRIHELGLTQPTKQSPQNQTNGPSAKYQ